MKKNGQNFSYEEFRCMMLECYEAFKQVMKVGSVMEQIRAIEELNTMHLIMKETIEKLEEKHNKSIQELEAGLLKNKFFQEVKKEFSEESKEVMRLIEETKLTRVTHKKGRRKRMENRLRVKE